MNIEEKWSLLEGYDLPYKVSNTGKVMAFNKQLNTSINKDGYLGCRLRSNGKYLRRVVHRLVAAYFVPNPESKSDVHHINFVKTDNNASNLIWCTPAENNNFNKNNPYIKRGENHKKFKGWYQIDGVRYTTTREAGRNLGISRQAVLDRCASEAFENYIFIKKP